SACRSYSRCHLHGLSRSAHSSSYLDEGISTLAMKCWRHVLPTALVFALAACPQRTAVWVEAGSTVNHLVLRIAEERDASGTVAIGVIRVDRCDASSTGSAAMKVTGPAYWTANVHRIACRESRPGFVSTALRSHGPQCLGRTH